MDSACYRSPHGPEVTPLQFIQLASPDYKKKGIFPYCKSCQEVVHVYGVHSTNEDTVPRFDHADIVPGTNPLDDCVLANRESRLRGLVPSGWDEQRAALIRARFFEDENLRLTYGFCLKMCRTGNLPVNKFRSMLKRADKKRIWAYVDIPVWAVAYILLTLENFGTNNKDANASEFHFIFDKPRGTNVSALWERSAECQIVKIFSDSGNHVETGDNPYPVSWTALIEKAGDVSWIKPSFLQALIV